MELQSGSVVYLKKRMRKIYGQGRVEVSRIYVCAEGSMCTAFIPLRHGAPLIIPEGREGAGMNAILSASAAMSRRPPRRRSKK